MSDVDDPAPASVRRLVSAVLGTTVRTWRRPTAGSVAETYLLELDDDPGRAVCKLAGASVWTGEVVEPAVRRLVADRTALPVPEVLASGRFVTRPTGELQDFDETDAPRSRWALYEFADGEPPSVCREGACDLAARRRLVADAGSILGRLHAWSAAELDFDRTGGLGRAPEQSTRLRVCDPTPPSVVDALSSAVRTPSDCSSAPRPVLCHGDFQPDNVLVEADGSITALLDWGNAHVGPAEYAVARAEVRFVDSARSIPSDERSRLRETFRSSYRDHAPLESGYENRAPLYKGTWVAQSILNLATVARTARGRTQLRRQLSK
ncbi:phosphotransferase family protein [Natrarchaeobius oligotrophus]|uniref:Aminoglycoside phosphotransferase family protein n=1 Tax=Natrarchaeobius chitinivorans TaxID=1679083 RepID=A0A3N6MD63_NATCH|nr:aminoglycoside phosphotransferase family protein [Natrarchaeobius chitinivorans]RQH01799.1 aminoglycoside phosphotransferase family protein [Natrarchaeobius chitinivorans]